MTNWNSQILRHNCHLKHIVEERIEGRMGRIRKRRIRPKQLLDDLKEKRGHWKIVGEALDRTLWRTRFGRNYGSVIREATE